MVSFYALGDAAAKPPESPQEWLDRMARAAQTLNYDGTFVYRNGVTMQSMRIIHRYDDQGERERLVALSGVAREVLRDSKQVTCILPDNQAVVVTKSRPRGFPYSKLFDADEGFGRHYEMSSQRGERIAQRHTVLIVVKARDEFRYGYRLWVDRDTGLLLKFELVGNRHETLEQIVYTNLDFPAHIPDALLEPGISGAGYTWRRNEGEPIETPPSGESAWHPDWLPDGFELEDRARNPTPVSGTALEHLVYSDGLASLSVFIERLDSTTEPLDGLSTMGAVNAYGRMAGDFQVTVVGEVPAATVQRVATSIEAK